MDSPGLWPLLWNYLLPGAIFLLVAALVVAFTWDVILRPVLRRARAGRDGER